MPSLRQLKRKIVPKEIRRPITSVYDKVMEGSNWILNNILPVLAAYAYPAAYGALELARSINRPPEPPIIFDIPAPPNEPFPEIPIPITPTDTTVGSIYAGESYGNLGGVPVSIMGMLPSGLTAALGQMTPAMRQSAAKASGRRGGRRSEKRRKKKAASAPRRKRSTAKRTLKRLKKGSAAAKAYMKKIRNMRK